MNSIALVRLWSLPGLALAIFFVLTGSPTMAERPNIILIMADDFGYECVRANGGESYATPHLDRLAASGLRFEECHVQPLCTPTRVQLMTGKYNIRNYLNFGTLLRSEQTFAQLLKQSGYATGIAGKWQLGREKDSPHHFGFDEACLWQQTRRPPRYINPGLEYNGVEKDFNQGEYGPDLVNDFALDFIDRHRGEDFFLYYPMILTHDPFQPTPDSPDWNPSLKTEREGQNLRHFAEMTSYMDKLLGKLLDKLDQLKLREQTLIMFIGDNGTHSTVVSQFRGGEYRGGKGKTTRRGTHVPFIASWPAVIQPGRVSRELISSTDFLPTICQAASVVIPQGIDGVSFLPQLRGESGKAREWLYCWYSPRQRLDLTVREYVADHHWKLYRSGEVFHLAEDPFEEKALALADLNAEGRSAIARLQGVLDEFREARPIALDQNFEAAMKAAEGDTQPAGPEKKKSKKSKKGR